MSIADQGHGGTGPAGVPPAGAGPAGAGLGAAFYREVVGPLLGSRLPRLRYAAARLGSGSDVLGLDDATSRDHDWRCRLTILVDEADRAAGPPVRELLASALPERFGEFPVRFATTWDTGASHRVEVGTVGDFAVSRSASTRCPACAPWTGWC